jgi:hypothetical protein
MEKRIQFLNMECCGEGTRTHHLFVDGKFVLSVPGHSAEGLKLHRVWSVVDQATVLFNGEPLTEENPDGYLCWDMFRVAYNYPEHITEPKKMERKVAPA